MIKKTGVASEVVDEALGDDLRLGEELHIRTERAREGLSEERIMGAPENSCVRVGHLLVELFYVFKNQSLCVAEVTPLDRFDEACAGLRLNVDADRAESELSRKGSAPHRSRGREERDMLHLDLSRR